MASSPAPSLASTALPGCFSPTPSQTAQSTCDDSTRPVGDVLDEFTISEPTSGVVPAISQLPAEFAAFLAQHGLCLSPEGAVPSPFVIANKSVTTSHGVNENGEKFVQQHVTVNTHEWYTPMLMRTPPIKPVNTETPVIARPPSAPKSTPPPHELNGGASGGASRVWRPEISQNTEFSKFQVSLEHNNSSVPPKGFNNAASPFGSTDPRVKHLQYNSPMNLYSSAAAAEQYAQQTQGLVPQSGNERARSEQPAYLRSETLKVLKEQEQNGNGVFHCVTQCLGHSLSSHPNPQGLPVCYICQRPILGLMAQAGGHHLHADCLACATCGTSLKNIGHHFIDGKFYCDIHQRLKRAASAGPGVDAALLARTPPTAAQPTRPVEPLRGQYQPEVLKATSPSPAAWTSSTTSQSVHTSTPRTHGVISPANRGVPSSQMYGTDFSRSASRGTSLAPPTTVPPPPPPASQPPLELNLNRLPSSLRSAVSPRRRARLPREWPPSKAQVHTTPYWNTDLHKRLSNPQKTTIDLIDAVQDMDMNPPLEDTKRRPSPRRLLIIEHPPPPASQPMTPLIRTNALTSPIPAESSEPSSVSEPAPPPPPTPPPETSLEVPAQQSQMTQTSPSLEGSPKKIKKKVPRNDPRRLTAIYRPLESSEVVTVELNPAPPAPVKLELGPATPEKVPEGIIGINVVSRPFKKLDEPPKPFKPVETSEFPSTRKRHSYNAIDTGVPSEENSLSSSKPSNTLPRTRADSNSTPSQHQTPRPGVSQQQYDTVPSYYERLYSDEAPKPVPREDTPQKRHSTNFDGYEDSLPIPESSKKRFSQPTSFSEPPPKPPTRPGNLKELPPLMKSKHVYRVTQRVPSINRRTPSPILNITVGDWKHAPDVVDESDIMTDDTSEVPYDIDESELLRIKRPDDTDATDIESEDEKERWMREEIELAKAEASELASEMSEATDDWRRKAMHLLHDDGQMERDVALVARLHKQLESCREMDEADRQIALRTMRRHQRTLSTGEDQQLSQLLASAISYVEAMVDEEESAPPQPPPREVFDLVHSHPLNPNMREREILEELSAFELPAPPPRAPFIPEIDYPIDSPIMPRKAAPEQPPPAVATEQLSHVLAELNSIMKPRSSDFITRKLTQVAAAQQPLSAPGARQVTRSALLNSEGSTLTQPASGGKVPFCEACKQQIRGAFVLAQGLSWCPEHFICANSACGRRLLECGFVEENGQKFCETCFESNIAPRCAKCSRPIVSDCLNALQKKWHPQCFTCAHCAKPFGNSAFYLEQGAPYCENDWNRLFTTKCYQCTYPIEAGDRWVEALGHAYHSNCFNCTRCNVNLEGESFYAKNGEPFCKLHA